MSWTIPTVRVTGELITAAIWNTDVVNNLKALGPALAGRITSAGGITSGTGFTASRTGTGTYQITFSTAFASAPAVTAAAEIASGVGYCIVQSISTTVAVIETVNGSGTLTDTAFAFVARIPS